jgi:general secretion pathway protein H
MQRGFSLIEILVALFVIVMLTSLVTLNLSSPERDRMAEDSAHTIASLLDYALEEAQYSGYEYGVFLSASEQDDLTAKLTFKRFERSGWVSLSDSILTGPIEIADGVSLELWVEGERIDLVPIPQDVANWRPSIRLWPSGEMTAGRAVISDTYEGSLQGWEVDWTLFGGATVTPVDR